MSENEDTGPKIKKLSQQLIDKIAAGEVVQRPSSAVKELIENSLDAGSSEISVTLLMGGLKQLTIEDNGSGIHKDDFPLLCERFATSKIKDFNDLSSLISFGFRGEALASISFVSHLKITSRRHNSDIGYSAPFKNGVMLLQEPDPANCTEGTTVDVQDLFHNYDVRKKSLNISEEKKRVLKLIGQFAIHHADLRFKLRSDGIIQFSTHNIIGSNTVQNRIIVDQRRERILQTISKLSDKSFTSSQHDLTEQQIKFQGTFSNIGATKKLKDITLFINNRLVENESIKRAIDRSYQSCYQSIHEDEGGYYCYVSIEMNPQNVDPNVHPTKKEVKFLFEQDISKELEIWIFENLKNNGVVKSFQIDAAKRVSNPEQTSKRIMSAEPTNVQANKQIRVDPRDQKITRFFLTEEQQDINELNDTQNPANEIQQELVKNLPININYLINIIQKKTEFDGDSKGNIEISQKSKDVQDHHKEVQQQLLSLSNKDQDEHTTQFFRNLSYLGCVSSNYFMAQHNDDLYLINSIPICQEVFKYEILRNFGRIQSDELENPLDIREILQYFLDFDEIPKSRKLFHLEHLDRPFTFVQDYVEHFKLLSDYLRDVVGIGIRQNKIEKLPNLFSLFEVSECEDLKEISYMLLRIITTHIKLLLLLQKVNFDSLLQSGIGLANEIASFFAWKLERNFKSEKYNFQESHKKKWDVFFEQTMFPLIKTKIFLPRLDISKFAVKLFKQEDAYKVFERC